MLRNVVGRNPTTRFAEDGSRSGGQGTVKMGIVESNGRSLRYRRDCRRLCHLGWESSLRRQAPDDKSFNSCLIELPAMVPEGLGNSFKGDAHRDGEPLCCLISPSLVPYWIRRQSFPFSRMVS